MPKLYPFKAITPAKNLIGRVSTKSINTYTPDELEKLHLNPYSFVHIVQPDYNEAPSSTANTKSRYIKVKSNFDEFLSNGYFEENSFESLYIYQQKVGNKSYTGIIGGACTDDYEIGLIKKHEQTLASREAIFTEYLKVCGFNAEPVLITHPHNTNIEQLIKNTMNKEATVCFQSEDGIIHSAWCIKDLNQITAFQNEFSKMEHLYIADGHHRTASSHLLSKQIQENQILSFFVSENEIEIFDFNRLVKDTNSLTKKQLLDLISDHFDIFKENKTLAKPTQNGVFSMYMEGEFYTLTFKHDKKVFPIDKRLDAQILTDYILSPILKINDLKTDNRIDFISGKDGLTSLEQKVNSGKFAIGFSLFPVTYSELTQIADNNLIMPPKSTWIEPKLRTGLTIYKFKDA